MNFREYSAEELCEISRRAGVVSGAARRRKREAIEREKIKSAAIREQQEQNRRQHQENIRTIREAASILQQSKHILDLVTQSDGSNWTG